MVRPDGMDPTLAQIITGLTKYSEWYAAAQQMIAEKDARIADLEAEVLAHGERLTAQAERILELEATPPRPPAPAPDLRGTVEPALNGG